MRLIDANKTIRMAEEGYCEECKKNGGDYGGIGCRACLISDMKDLIDQSETVDAVPVKVIESWLYSIAMNNVDNSLGNACEEIINRLDGLVMYNAERKDGEQDDREP